MHYLRISLRGSIKLAELVRDRLEDRGARRTDDRGRHLLLVTRTDPAELRPELLHDVSGLSFTVERFELLGAELIRETWSRKGTRSSRTERFDRLHDGDRFDDHDWIDAYGRHARRELEWTGSWPPEVGATKLDPRVAHAALALLHRHHESPYSADGGLQFVEALGRVAGSRTAEDPELLVLGAMALDAVAVAASRDRGLDLAHQRAHAITSAAWRTRTDRPRSQALVEAVAELAYLAARQLERVGRGHGALRAGLERPALEAVIACLEALAGAAEDDVAPASLELAA